ncbi:hypothetical protein DUNSADRAFT_2655 [Dunaliella salina]|uniref:Uncharacterized protein n=1 Tax=Dunaliella salina TaxID=3046 RepID=A0ABQ7H872_DUNSA|nr:hypothetical protein DUNSADRAFT_2655 [Dunaliella salina]|eukprot:KAF5843042.1 hypothetical protein DUNSADRAFT_2655 [Dunaliella salina]
MERGVPDPDPKKQELRKKVAQEHFGKSWEECDTQERQSVGGHIGGPRGGGRRKSDMEKEGETEEGKLKAYSEMGKMGAKKGGYGNELMHDPKLKEKYTGDPNYGGSNLD